jgi:hypothetical protein
MEMNTIPVIFCVTEKMEIRLGNRDPTSHENGRVQTFPRMQRQKACAAKMDTYRDRCVTYPKIVFMWVKQCHKPPTWE